MNGDTGRVWSDLQASSSTQNSSPLPSAAESTCSVAPMRHHNAWPEAMKSSSTANLPNGERPEVQPFMPSLPNLVTQSSPAPLGEGKMMSYFMLNQPHANHGVSDESLPSSANKPSTSRGQKQAKSQRDTGHFNLLPPMVPTTYPAGSPPPPPPRPHGVDQGQPPHSNFLRSNYMNYMPSSDPLRDNRPMNLDEFSHRLGSDRPCSSRFARLDENEIAYKQQQQQLPSYFQQQARQPSMNSFSMQQQQQRPYRAPFSHQYPPGLGRSNESYSSRGGQYYGYHNSSPSQPFSARQALPPPQYPSAPLTPQDTIYRTAHAMTHRGMYTPRTQQQQNYPSHIDHSNGSFCPGGGGGGWGSKVLFPRAKPRKRNKKGAPIPFILSNICSTCGHAFLAEKDEAFFSVDDFYRMGQMGTPHYPLSSPGVNGKVFLTGNGFVQQVKSGASQRATHFLALRLSNRDLIRNISRFQEYIVGSSPKLIGTKMSLKKLHVSLLVVSLAGGLIPQAIAAMKRAVELFTTARGGSIHKDAKAQDIRSLQRVVALERSSICGDDHERLDKLEYYPLRLTFDRVASFGTSVLVATLPPHQVALLTNFHEILALCFASVGIPIVGPGSHLNGVLSPEPVGLLNPKTVGDAVKTQMKSQDLRTLQTNGPNMGSMAAASYYALAGTGKIPKFVLCGVCESKSHRKTLKDFSPSMTYWNTLLGKIIGLDKSSDDGSSMIQSLSYSGVTKQLLAQTLVDQPVGMAEFLRCRNPDSLGYNSQDCASTLMEIPTSTLYFMEDSEHRSQVDSYDRRLRQNSSAEVNNSAHGASMSSDKKKDNDKCYDGAFSDQDSLLFSESDSLIGDEEVGDEVKKEPQNEYSSHSLSSGNLAMRKFGSEPASFNSPSGRNTASVCLEDMSPEEQDNLYDISKMGMYFFPQVTLLKTSQAGRRTKTPLARRQMRHLRLHPKDYHDAVVQVRKELLPTSAPLEADLYGVSVPFGGDIAISVELLEMSRSDEDGYYKRVGIAPLISGIGEMVYEQFDAYREERASSISVYESPSSARCDELFDENASPEESPRAGESSIHQLSDSYCSSLEEGEIRDEIEVHNIKKETTSQITSTDAPPLIPKLRLEGLAFASTAPGTPVTPSTLSRTSTSLRVKANSLSPRKQQIIGGSELNSNVKSSSGPTPTGGNPPALTVAKCNDAAVISLNPLDEVNQDSVPQKDSILHTYWGFITGNALTESRTSSDPSSESRILHTYWGSVLDEPVNFDNAREKIIETEEQLMMNRMLETPWGLIVKGLCGWEAEAKRFESGSTRRIGQLNSLISPLDILMSSGRNYFDKSRPLELTSPCTDDNK
eukprot:GHVH01010901.1.p1 GENE.GHVH01010901.1~~GHVH01010901.1.p1  ORF type:complete len:1337 (+),score=185.80 GHVH01010901.1:782-4792(+)